MLVENYCGVEQKHRINRITLFGQCLTHSPNASIFYASLKLLKRWKRRWQLSNLRSRAGK